MREENVKIQTSGKKVASWLPVLLLSAISLGLSVFLSGFLRTWESGLTDLRFRLRYFLTSSPRDLTSPDILFLGIDPKTVGVLGRFGAGRWLTREPYIDQLIFLQNHAPPSVLAYDIIFQDPLGNQARKESRVSESDDKLKDIIKSLSDLSKNPMDFVSQSALGNMSTLLLEQGNDLFTLQLASISAQESFPILLGYYFRGGWPDPQARKIKGWSDEDVFGSSENGDEARGRRIPYLRDMAIPPSDIHFPNGGLDDTDYCADAVLPAQEMLDYSLLGSVNGPSDSDGVVRKLPLILGFRYQNRVIGDEKTVFVPSMALAACLIHLGLPFPLPEKSVEVLWGSRILVRAPNRPEIRIPMDEEGCLYLNPLARLQDFRAISFVDVAPSRFGSGASLHYARALRFQNDIRGRMAFVGVGSGGTDMGAFPLGSSVSKVYAHLTAANNILTGKFIAPLDPQGEVLLFGILFLVFTTLCLLEKTSRLGLVSLLFMSFYGLAAYAGIHRNMAILPMIGPLGYIVLCSFGILSYRFFTEERARKKIRGMFSTMVSGKVLEFLEQNPDSFSLRGHNAEATVMFADIANFTALSEAMRPERVTELLNAYLTPVTDCILSHGGYLDKYMGDGLMAVWGAPFADPEHAANACLSALEQRRIVESLRAAWQKSEGLDIRVRIGLNSGVVTAGNMGSERKFQYTVIGDVVNLASRLEPVNKDFGTDIILGPETRRMIGERFITRRLCRIKVRGRAEAAPIYELLGREGTVGSSVLLARDAYEEALQAFQEREWDRCLQAIERSLAHHVAGPALLLKEWTLRCRENAPPSGWQGEYNRLEKN